MKSWGAGSAPHASNINHDVKQCPRSFNDNQENTMRPPSLHDTQNTQRPNKWLRQLCTTGFIFFFIKGVAWIAVTTWALQ